MSSKTDALVIECEHGTLVAYPHTFDPFYHGINIDYFRADGAPVPCSRTEIYNKGDGEFELHTYVWNGDAEDYAIRQETNPYGKYAVG